MFRMVELPPQATANKKLKIYNLTKIRFVHRQQVKRIDVFLRHTK